MTARPEARCPLRPGEPCSLCQLDVTGPQDCGLVFLVMDDEELRTQLRPGRTGTAAADEKLSPDPLQPPE